jgi:small conductance mechanosensitive channel
MKFENFELAQLDFEKILVEYVIPYSTNLLFAIGIFVIGSMVVKFAVVAVGKALRKTKLDSMLVSFVSNILRWILLLFVIVAALDRLGVDTTSFIAVLGAAGLAVGLALKDSLQNFASGVMLILFRPFQTGDFIEAGGAEGVVEEIRIFSTQMRTADNREVIVPNSDIFSGKITNNTARDTRRIDLVFGIGYEDDLRLARGVIEEILEGDDRILKDPAPFIAVGELSDSSVNFVVRPWVKTSDYFQVKCDITERIKLAFDDSGISIPYPQMDVHFDSANKE